MWRRDGRAASVNGAAALLDVATWSAMQRFVATMAG